jgi:tetratricopeptide (TPR) repeat protein
MAATLWFYVRDDKRQGPVDFEHLVTMLLAGQLPHNALVWHQGLREWSQADGIPEIAEQLPPPLPQAARAPRPPAALETTRSSGDTGPLSAVSTAAATAVPARVDELRKRLEKDPSSRLFAQLAEELRKEGQLEEAIAVCRTGLQKNPNYPSARITLGRALIDSGDAAAARVELETVLQGAPDNILARKLLDECLASMGLQPAAAPPVPAGSIPEPSGKWWKSLLGGSGAPAGTAAVASAATPASPPVVPPAAPPAAQAATPASFPEEPEDEEPVPAPRAPDEDLPPIPLVAADDEPFELAAAYEVPVVKRPVSSDTGPIAVVPPSPPLPPPTPSATIKAPQPPVPPPPAAAPAPPPVPAASPPPPPSAPSAAASSAAAPPAPPPVPPPGRTPKKTASDLTALLDDEDAAAAPRIFVPSLMPPTGSLADTDFPDLIHGLHDRRWTGTIELNRGRVDSTVTVQNGRLTFATSTNRDERLGELLLRKEKITLRQYYEAGKAIRKGKRLGAVLVEQGALDARDLVKAVVDHTQEVIYSVFHWTEGFYRLREGLEGDGETITLKLSTANIILEGIRRITAWGRIERGIGGPDARYVRADDYKDRLPEMTLTPEKLLLLAGHEGERDVDTMCKESELSDYEVCRTIWALRVIGFLKQVPPVGVKPS